MFCEPVVARQWAQVMASATLLSAVLRTMRWINMDVALVKNILITETKTLQFRAEAFNVFNHMVLGLPGTSGTSAASIAPSFSNGAVSYGTSAVVSTLANSPRQLQLALRFIF